MALLTRIWILALVLSIPTAFSVAQSIPLNQSILQLTTIPENPGPGEVVSARVDSYNFDLDSTEVAWYVDNVLQTKGIGSRQIKVTAPSLGKIFTIKVIAKHKTLGDLEQSLTLQTGDVELVWESIGYTPPFYRGKTLHSYGGLVRIVAVPRLTDKNGNELSANTLIYTWKKNGMVQQNQSGYGKSSMIMSDDSYIRDGNDMSVEVSNLEHTVTANRVISIPPIVSKVVIYEKNPILGVLYNKAISSFYTLTGDEVEFVAEPFFFSTQSRTASFIEYIWTVNDQKFETGQEKGSVVLRVPAGKSGQAKLLLSVQNQKQILQGGKVYSTISFGN